LIDKLVTSPKVLGQSVHRSGKYPFLPSSGVVFVPAAERYTIGVFRISLVEPAAVEPTVFQLQVTTAD